MADKIQKFLASLPNNKLAYVLGYLERIQKNKLVGMDVKPLKGHKQIYRARIGVYRIIFKPAGSNKTEILHVGKRNDKTYRDF